MKIISAYILLYNTYINYECKKNIKKLQTGLWCALKTRQRLKRYSAASDFFKLIILNRNEYNNVNSLAHLKKERKKRRKRERKKNKKKLDHFVNVQKMFFFKFL